MNVSVCACVCVQLVGFIMYLLWCTVSLGSYDMSQLLPSPLCLVAHPFVSILTLPILTRVQGSGTFTFFRALRLMPPSSTSKWLAGGLFFKPLGHIYDWKDSLKMKGDFITFWQIFLATNLHTSNIVTHNYTTHSPHTTNRALIWTQVKATSFCMWKVRTHHGAVGDEVLGNCLTLHPHTHMVTLGNGGNIVIYDATHKHTKGLL